MNVASAIMHMKNGDHIDLSKLSDGPCSSTIAYAVVINLTKGRVPGPEDLVWQFRINHESDGTEVCFTEAGIAEVLRGTRYTWDGDVT